jgi:hypothetical protein
MAGSGACLHWRAPSTPLTVTGGPHPVLCGEAMRSCFIIMSRALQGCSPKLAGSGVAARGRYGSLGSGRMACWDRIAPVCGGCWRACELRHIETQPGFRQVSCLALQNDHRKPAGWSVKGYLFCVEIRNCRPPLEETGWLGAGFINVCLTRWLGQKTVVSMCSTFRKSSPPQRLYVPH